MTSLVAGRAEGAGPAAAPVQRDPDGERGFAGQPAGPGPASRPVLRARGARWLAGGFVAAGILMIPWLFVLATQLPASTRAWHWPAAWVGLDSLEALGLLAMGMLLARRDDRYRLAAMATATLLLTDAWFDVTTAGPGAGRLLAIAMAVFPELPLAALCFTLALHRRTVS